MKNPEIDEFANGMGLWGDGVCRLEESVQTWLAQPGPALLPALPHVKVNPMQMLMPPSPFISPKAVIGMAVYSAGAMLHGKGHVWETMVESIP